MNELDPKLGPNLFIVGAPKCGTTAICAYLKTHPDIFFHPDKKEPHHYNTDMPGFLWYSKRTAYLKLFASAEANAAQFRGDASVQYLYSTEAAANIASDVPDARILICLRASASFIRSYHNQMLVNLDEDLTDLAAAWDVSGTFRTVAREPRLLDYKSVGLFAEQIARYRKVFPDKQIRILTLEEFSADPASHYRAILYWLGLPDDGREDFGRVHSAVSLRSRRLAGLLKRPPPLMRILVGLVKRTFGVKSLGLAKLATRANKIEGYSTAELDPDIAEIISHHYANDQDALAKHRDLWLVQRSGNDVEEIKSSQ